MPSTSGYTRLAAARAVKGSVSKQSKMPEMINRTRGAGGMATARTYFVVSAPDCGALTATYSPAACGIWRVTVTAQTAKPTLSSAGREKLVAITLLSG